jgi:hypothetical protein
VSMPGPRTTAPRRHVNEPNRKNFVIATSGTHVAKREYLGNTVTVRTLAQRFRGSNHIDLIHQPRPEERAVARVSKDGHRRDRANLDPSRRRASHGSSARRPNRQHSQQRSCPEPARPLLPGDFDGDGKFDLLWRDTSGNLAIWFMNGAQVTSTAGLGVVPLVWSVAQTGDYDRDGKSDILWRDTSGNVSLWFMNGGQVTSSAGLGNVSTIWTIQGVNAD